MIKANLETTFRLISKQFFLVLVSLGLLAGGVFLLYLRIPGWSLILGLPATQIGIIFLILTFDEIVRGKVGPNSLHMIPCSVCGKLTLVSTWQKEKICEECQRKIAKKLREEKG